jgi:DNA-binding PadR family transcriptional regulator
MSLDHLLLGLLREPAAGYDLKSVFDQTLRHFWSVELAQIYPTLQRLERRGLLRSTREPSDRGPARRVYRRTAAGRAELLRWLAQEPDMPPVRVPYLAQLCFLGELGDPARTRDFVAALRRAFAERCGRYGAAEAQWFPAASRDPTALPDAAFHGWLTVRFGLSRLEAALAWCDEVLPLLERRTPRRPPGRRRKGRS